ncbi:MAG: Fic family protein [Lacrimispora sp.]|uniref:Fic/DOC family protein n=1 Tax=Lacrimispora sp. TaxID=2719234 RepID=UPI0039E38CDD
MSDKIYCYPDSDVLKNRLNIRDQERLYEAEKKLVMFRLNDLLESPVNGKFDFKHLQLIHKCLFQDVYSWAGKVRTVDIAKSNLFCKVQFINMQAQDIFDKLREERYLAGLPKDEFIKKISYYFSEINALHPFREGNGRTQREFIRQLALYNGYMLYFARTSESEMLEASADSFLCNYDKMEALFKKILF